MLDPKHPLSPDILSYFKQAAASTEESEQVEVLPQVPVAGLGRKVLGSNKRSTKLSTRSTRNKGRSVKQQAKSKQAQQQPTIITAFANYQQVMEQKEDGEDNEVLPDNILDDVWDFDLSQPTCSPTVNEETKSDSGHSLSDEDTTESSQLPLEDKVKHTTTHISPRVCGAKRQKSTTACCSSPTATKNKKPKLSRASSATKRQTDQTLHDYNDPFDELAACQARKAKGESSVIKHQWVRIDEDEDTVDLEDTLKSTSTAATVTNTYSTDEEEEFDRALDSLASSSSKQQQQRESIEATPSTLTSSLKRFSTASQQHDRESIETVPTAITTTSQTVPNFSTKDVEDMLFGISTQDNIIDLSPVEFPDLTSCSVQLEEHTVPRLARSLSQPVAHCSSEDQEETTSSSWTRAKSYSDSALETEFKGKFDDITNTVMSPRKDGATCPQKKSDNVPARRSIVDLTQTPGMF